MGVTLQERGGHARAGIAFYNLADNFGAVLTPCHSEYALGRTEVRHAECDGGCRNLVAVVILADDVAYFVAEKHQAAIA